MHQPLSESMCAYTLVEVFVTVFFHDIGVDSLVGGTLTVGPVDI